MKKTTVSICIIALLVGLLCGCSNKAKEQTDTLRIMAQFKTENLDPTVGTSHDPNLMSSVFGALIRRGENRSLEPAIIQDWTMSEDALETTFTIREGVKFSDGSDLTADDVIFSLDKMKEDPLLMYSYGKYTWEKIDDLTFTMTSASVLNDPAELLSVSFIVPSDSYDAETFIKNPIGAGPYKITSIETDGTVNLTANEYYYDEAPHYKTLVIKAPLNASAAVIALQNGEVDILMNAASDQLPIVRDDDRLEVVETSGYTSTGVWFYGPMRDDQNLRLAIAYAIDREKLVAIACNGEATVSSDLIASKTLGKLAGAVPMSKFDVEKAKEYLAASNYHKGDVLTLTVFDKPADAQCIMDDLKEIGIEVTIEQMDMNSFYQAVMEGNMGMCIMSNGAENATTARLLQNFSSAGGDSIVFSDECDALIAQCASEADAEKRDELCKQIMEIQAELCNVAPLYETNGNICYVKSIEGITEYAASATYLYPETLK